MAKVGLRTAQPTGNGAKMHRKPYKSHGVYVLSFPAGMEYFLCIKKVTIILGRTLVKGPPWTIQEKSTKPWALMELLILVYLGPLVNSPS